MSLEDDIKAAALAIRTSVQELTEEVTALRAQLAEDRAASKQAETPQDILDETHRRAVGGGKVESAPEKSEINPKQEVPEAKTDMDEHIRPEVKVEPTTTDKNPTFTEVQTAFRKFVGCHTKEECIAILTRFEIVGKLTEEKIDPLMHQAFLDALIEDGHNQELVD